MWGGESMVTAAYTCADLTVHFSKKTICNLTGKHCDIKRTNDMDKYPKNVELWFKSQTM